MIRQGALSYRKALIFLQCHCLQVYSPRSSDEYISSVQGIGLILSVLFLPDYSFVIDGYTTLFSYILFVIANYIGMRFALKKEGVKFELFKAKDLILIFIGFVLSAYLGVALYGSLPARIAVTLIVLLILFIFRKPFIKRLSVLRKPKGSGTVSISAEENGQ